MTEREICISYRGARYPTEQLQVLADLNCMDKIGIVSVLVRNREKLTESTIRLMYGWMDRADRRIAKKEKKFQEIGGGCHYGQEVQTKRLERLKCEIEEDERRYKEIAEMLNMAKG